MITFILLLIGLVVTYLGIAFAVAKLFWAYGKDPISSDNIEDRSDAVLLGLIWPLSVLCFIATHSLKGVGNVFNAITNFMEKKL